MMKQYQIIKRAPIFIWISVAILLLGVIFFGARWAMFGLDKTLNLSIDYTGGTIMTIDLGQTFNESDVKAVVEGVGITDVQIQKSKASSDAKDETVAVVRFKQEKSKNLADNQAQLRNKITEALKAKYPKTSTNPKDNTVESIGVTASREMVQNSVVAVLLACAAILVYVAWRFDSGVKKAMSTRLINTAILVVALAAFYFFRTNIWVIASVTLAAIVLILLVSIKNKMYSGLASVLALFHDVAIMLVAMVIFQIPFSSSFMAAALTIIGYSINDTIVIFDRIRENEAKHSLKSMSCAEMANLSLNEMLGRSIKTSVTTLLTAIAIYVLGVDAIKEFAFPMIIGLVAGSYSTIFIAVPAWAHWHRKDEAKQLKASKKTA